MNVNPRNSPELGNDPDLTDLLRALEETTGADQEVDATLASCLGLERADYSSDAALSRELVQRLLPRSRLQVGYDVNGILPCATLDDGGEHMSAIAPTVPVAILRVLVEAMLKRDSREA